MKVTNWKRKLAAALVAGGVWFGGASAQAQINHLIGDASFDDTAVPAADGYAYFNGPPDTAWESSGNWWYNTNYATVVSPKRTDPRTGDQALHGIGAYNWQDLGDTFESGRMYTYSVYLGGDTDSTDDFGGSGGALDGSDRSWLYIYNADETPDLVTTYFDGDSLIGGYFDRDGSFTIDTGSGAATNAGWTIGGGNEWGLATISYTATADDDGHPIGVAMYGRGDATLEDVSLMSVPEPSMILLCGLGIAGLAVLRRRTPG